MNIETVQQQLKKLKLSTAARELEDVLSGHKKAASVEWVSQLLERELDSRKERALEGRIKRAQFPEVTSLESFDWEFNSKIKKDKIEKLANLDFIKNNQIALFLGSPGTGKTHVALAIGVLAAKRGYKVYCTSAKKLSAQIRIAKLKNTLDVLFKKILSSHLWIIDDWGVVSFERDIGEEIFDLLDRRKFGSAMILTSNRDIKEWPEVFPDPVIANAAIDRVFDRAEAVSFEGKSYRLKGRIKIAKIDIVTHKD
jgi:DNA replication protein DnaC